MVTHLIAATPTGKKYEHAVNWKMKIVSWEWFEQSLQRGMVLDEECYNPMMAVEERGKGAWDRRLNASPPPLGKRTRNSDTDQLVNPNRRKLRRAASSRMGTQSEALWAGITAAGSGVAKEVHDDWTEDDIDKQAALSTNAPINDVEISPHDDVQPEEDSVSKSRGPSLLPSNSSNGIFEGRVVFVHNFDSEKVSSFHVVVLDQLNVAVDQHPATTFRKQWRGCYYTFCRDG